jgi:hypothetical protein
MMASPIDAAMVTTKNLTGLDIGIIAGSRSAPRCSVGHFEWLATLRSVCC